MDSLKISESTIQTIFESQFIDIVFDKTEWDKPAPIGKYASRLWNYNNKNKHPVSVDIARVNKHNSKNIFFFELKINIALAFSQCGYILLGSQLYHKEYNATVHPYMVTLCDNLFSEELIASLPIFASSNSLRNTDLINPFQIKTGLGFIFLQIDKTNKSIDKIHIKDIPSGISLAGMAKKAGINAHLFCNKCTN